MKQNTIKKLSDREHILQRASMYIGAVAETSKEVLVLEDNKFIYKQVKYVPGLLKIIDEIIDNSLDEAIRTNFKYSTNISISFDKEKTQFEIQDDGRGLPQTIGHDGLPMGVIAFTEARSGSNFADETKANGIGMNGIGSYLTNVYSTYFHVDTRDGNNKLVISSKNNAESYTYKISPLTKPQHSTTVTFCPDLEKFKMKSIDQVYFSLIANRCFHLVQSFPEIKIKLNLPGISQTIKNLSPKKYLEMFSSSDSFEMIQGENYFFGITSNEFDDFRQFSYVNGLNIQSGNHTDYLIYEVQSRIRNSLMKKYPSIKPGDIKNKLSIICIMKDFSNFQSDSQTKEKLTNAEREIKVYFGDIDFDSLAKKILKNPAIIDPITEVYKIKEEFKKRQELKDLEKPRKNFKSEKYLPSIGERKYLLLTEGQSASGGLIPVLGRKNCGYYTLKGKPLNAYSSPQSKFTQNVELSELYKIIQNENYEYVIYATDQDLDGYHIRGLLTGFFTKYLPDMKGRIGMLNTPVIGIKKNNKLLKWYYNLNDAVEVKAGEVSKYMKGLGSWKSDDLKYIVQQDGLDKMIVILDWDNDEIIDDWLSDSKSDVRKEYIRANDFNIAKL